MMPNIKIEPSTEPELEYSDAHEEPAPLTKKAINNNSKEQTNSRRDANNSLPDDNKKNSMVRKIEQPKGKDDKNTFDLSTFFINTNKNKENAQIKQESSGTKPLSSEDVSICSKNLKKKKRAPNNDASSFMSKPKLKIPRKDNGSNESSKEAIAEKGKTDEASVGKSYTRREKRIGNEEPAENPGNYEEIKCLMYDSFKENLLEREELKNLLPGLERAEEIDLGLKIANWSLDEWIECGEKLQNDYRQLVYKLVKERMELSYKFQVITSVINDRASALNQQGKVLDEKLIKIKELGKEILNII
ncbi:Ecm11p NDAI_0H01780 [Naumovozyma dairenensis CBS 421]|uniref:Extracellular mutant protein 11 C-terminal domain-containing protein n=1 Tax=Naumovozyma dairenensis (strain ATCC 10597 / BCRC 20456 / CBS 421 / NBRC 0211 / NRRL Y-12639) TaxID=1071378 RepID=G0WEZ1_NAUDC|nr:hypothetical protein NDAI_0H01780 [Naumovozyma dairenensis CBS 421]CCD26352.1 hypothetical protein NDAI_0H01780 [Naumovozyma dairenensis CBS 421]